MPWKELARRILYLGRRSRFEAELADEIQFHIEMRADELEQSGLSRSDALAQASREFGHATRAREEARAAWQFRWLEDVGFTDTECFWKYLNLAMFGGRKRPGGASAQR